MNDGTERVLGKSDKNKERPRWLISLIALVLVLSLLPSVTIADTGIEEGEIKQHDLFEFEAFISHDGITDGTAEFDANDEPGNDSGPNNGVVRTFDTVTYPVKMTINPKKGDSLNNILIRLTGTLENGITEDRVNANFAIGGTENLETEAVSFVQEYTIEQTGNSIMLPVTVEVQGAPHGMKLTPTIQVEVVSIDGEALDTKVATVFDELPAVTTSAKVSLKGLINKGLGGTGYPYYPYGNMYPGGTDENGTHAFSVSWSSEKLPGKTDMRGSTFPDKDGTINYTIELYGEVYWDNSPVKKGTEAFDFEGRDTPFLLFDHQPIEDVRNKIGQPHMLWDGKPYTNRYAGQYVAANSKMKDFNDATIKKNAYNTVWDSGEWTVDAPEQTKTKAIYKGTNTGFTIGSTFPIAHSYVADNGIDKVYGVNDRVFSTHSFLVDLQNEYRIGGVNNPDNLTNNVYYRARVILDNYTDAEGNVTEYNKSYATSFTLRNGTGSISAYGTFQAYPSGYTSPANPRNYNSPVGDASILVGQDVNFTPRLNPSNTLYGGYTAAYRWNTDAFELTKNYAGKAEANIFARGYKNLSFAWVTNDRENQTVKYGVAKFTDNSFENFTSKGIDDYTWYDTYDLAVDKGKVGAMLSDVNAAIGGMKGAALNIPLKVRHDNIGFGSTTKDGTPVIAVINADAHYDAERTVTRDVTANRLYANPSLWDETGTLLEKQKPIGGGVNFESLGIVPGKTSTGITANKDTYYNSETIKWNVKSGIVLPPYGVPTGIDTGVTLTQTLPKGLDYKTGSGTLDGQPVEPELVRNAAGETELIWNVLIDVKASKIPEITFDTTINPFALTTGVQSGVTVKNVIESALDGRPEKARTSTETVTVLKVGMVGIHERIDKTYGKKDSAYTVTLSPYTTIEDELDVTGLTHLPLSGDEIGSDYEGEASLEEIQVNVDRKHEDDVSVYLNRSAVYDNQPQKVDVSTGGWYEYTGDPAELDGAVSLWFRVNGLMTNTDDITIDVTVKTDGNAFGDTYMNETVVNSATGYRLSPVSNRVRYSIRADLELGLERVRIYTNLAELGLPVNVRVAQRVLDADAVKDLPVTLAVYDSETGDKVTEKTMKQSELQTETELMIPGDGLTPADVKNYDIRIEGVDESTVWVKDGESRLDADGHTAIKKNLTNADKKSNGSVAFTGVIMTERALRGDLVTYSETLTIPKITSPRVKAGYGFEFDSNLTYTSDLMADVENRLGVTYSPDSVLRVDNRLMDSSLAYRDDTKSASSVPLVKADEPGQGASLITGYSLPKLYLEQGTGLTFSVLQKERGEMTGAPIDAGHNLYVPLWSTPIGTYDAAFESTEPLGAHRVTFDLMNEVEVYGSMFSYIGSETPETDELLIRPMNANDDEDN